MRNRGSVRGRRRWGRYNCGDMPRGGVRWRSTRSAGTRFRTARSPARIAGRQSSAGLPPGGGVMLVMDGIVMWPGATGAPPLRRLRQPPRRRLWHRPRPDGCREPRNRSPLNLGRRGDTRDHRGRAPSPPVSADPAASPKSAGRVSRRVAHRSSRRSGELVPKRTGSPCVSNRQASSR